MSRISQMIPVSADCRSRYPPPPLAGGGWGRGLRQSWCSASTSVVTAATKAVDRTSPYHTVAPPAGQIAGREFRNLNAFGAEFSEGVSGISIGTIICGSATHLWHKPLPCLLRHRCPRPQESEHRPFRRDLRMLRRRQVNIAHRTRTPWPRDSGRTRPPDRQPGRLLGDRIRLAVGQSIRLRSPSRRTRFRRPRRAQRHTRLGFFDRGLIDAAAALERLTGEPTLAALAQAHRYHNRIFLVPPWPEIYVTDTERRNDFDEAIVEQSICSASTPHLVTRCSCCPRQEHQSVPDCPACPAQ